MKESYNEMLEYMENRFKERYSDAALTADELNGYELAVKDLKAILEYWSNEE